MQQSNVGDRELPCSIPQANRIKPRKVRKVRLFSEAEVGLLFDKELVDTSYWGERQVTSVGEDSSLRTFGVVFDDTKGLRVLADTQYFIELHGNEVCVDATTLCMFISKYAYGDIDAAEKYLSRHSVSVD